MFTTACSGVVRKGEKPSEDWSRSVVVGEDVVGSLGMVVNESGDRTHLVWPYEDESGRKLRFVQLDEQASITAAKDLEYPGHIRSSRLVSAGPSSLHLFWATREAGGANWELWHQLFDLEGNPTSQPKALTEKGATIGRYEVQSDGYDGVIVVWDMGNTKGLKAMRLDSAGDLIDGPHVITTSGSYPSFRLDPEGGVHVTWLYDRSFFYTELNVDALSPSEIVEVVDLDIWGTLNASGDTLQGPALGYADGWVYLFWSIVSLTDTEVGTGVAEYAAFPKGSPANLQPSEVWLIPSEDQPYVEVETSLALTYMSLSRDFIEAVDEFGELVQAEHSIGGEFVDIEGAVSSYVLSPATMIGEGEELAVAWAVSQERGIDTHLQIATTVFSKGRYVGYNFAGKTAYISEDPTLAVDRTGNLYVTWREGAVGETVYFATTKGAAKASLDRLDMGDLVAAGPQSLVDASASIAFTPVAVLCWVVPGLLVLVIWQFARTDNTLAHRSTWVPLGIALLMFYGMKLAFLPTFTSYVPLSAWLYIPPSLELPLRVGFPLLILAAALLASTRMRKRYGNSALVFFFVWVATDGLLTLIFYGVNLLGTF
jgi:hypothetical protein